MNNVYYDNDEIYPLADEIVDAFSKHDVLHKFWNGRNKDNLYTNDYFHAEPFGYGVNWYFGNEINFDKTFNKLCVFLDSKEKQYFEEHDEYSILKHEFVNDSYKECFGVHISQFTCDGHVYIYDNKDDWDAKRRVTIDELKTILEARKRSRNTLQKLQKKLILPINLSTYFSFLIFIFCFQLSLLDFIFNSCFLISFLIFI